MADPTPPPHPLPPGPGAPPIPPAPGDPGTPVPATKHPKRGTAGTGNHTNMVADGRGGWQTVAGRRQEDQKLDSERKQWLEGQGLKPKEERTEK